MKISGIINSEISSILSLLGHTDTIVIADAGLPIHPSLKRIDLSLKRGVPSFIDVLSEIKKDMIIESIILAEEIKEFNKNIHDATLNILEDVPYKYVLHEEFKKMTHNARAIVRTGEISPYSNIILKSGVFF